LSRTELLGGLVGVSGKMEVSKVSKEGHYGEEAEEDCMGFTKIEPSFFLLYMTRS
jgi:hypothetical protein